MISAPLRVKPLAANVQDAADSSSSPHNLKAISATVVEHPDSFALGVISKKAIRKTPRVNQAGKGRELIRFGVTRLRVSLCVFASPTSRQQRPLSDKGLYTRNYVEPLFNWWGTNRRVLMSQSLQRVDVDVPAEGTNPVSLLNGASHNYAGFYQTSVQAEALQRQCLESLPVSRSHAVPMLRDEVHRALRTFVGADFCFTYSTGYGANMLALPALLAEPDTIAVMDRDSHNSMFTGAFLSGKTVHKFAHSNMMHLEIILKGLGSSCTKAIVCIEGLYSMGGDVPPLDELHRLKQQYGFTLFCDEAHSLWSLGSTGRGCLEFWNENHPEAPVPKDLIDVRTGTLSKAVGGIGGFVAGEARFETAIRTHNEQQEEQENISLLTSTMIQTLWVLKQPRRTANHLWRLAEMARFCRTELQRRGVCVYGDDVTQILPIWAGRSSVAAKMSYVLRGEGLLASPITTPAVPFWESRVRINLASDYSDIQVNQLLNAITSAAARVNVRRSSEHLQPQPFVSTYKLGGESGKEEADKAFDEIQALIHATSAMVTQGSDCSAVVIQAGHASRIMYGVGSGSVRWIAGTFAAHLAVEAEVARLTGAEATLTYGDPSVGLASTIAALARPLSGYKKHCMLYPAAQSQCVRNGLMMAAPASKILGSLLEYRDLAHLVSSVRERTQNRQSANICFTVYLHVDAFDDGRIVDFLEDLVGGLGRSSCAMTVLLHSPSRLLDMRTFHPHPKLHLLLYGSFTQTLGLPGGYLAGPKCLIPELRYTSRGYMFTTSPPPFIMDMIFTSLKTDYSMGL